MYEHNALVTSESIDDKIAELNNNLLQLKGLKNTAFNEMYGIIPGTSLMVGITGMATSWLAPTK